MGSRGQWHVAIGSCRENSPDKPAKVSLPADSHMTWKNSEHQAAEHERHEKAEQDAPDTPGVPSAQKKESEISEDHAARANMN